MPTYEFKCKNCGNQFEANMSIDAKKDTKCPRCKSGELNQLIGKISIIKSSPKSCGPGCCGC